MLRANIEILTYAAWHIVKGRESDRDGTAADQVVFLPDAIENDPVLLYGLGQARFPLLLRLLFADLRFVQLLQFPQSVHLRSLDDLIIHAFLPKNENLMC